MIETTLRTTDKYTLARGGNTYVIWESGVANRMNGGPTVTVKRHIGNEKYIRNLWNKLTK